MGVGLVGGGGAWGVGGRLGSRSNRLKSIANSIKTTFEAIEIT